MLRWHSSTRKLSPPMDEYGFIIYVNGEEHYYFWDWDRED